MPGPSAGRGTGAGALPPAGAPGVAGPAPHHHAPPLSRARRRSSDTSRRTGGSGSFSTDDETERPHATGPAPFRSVVSVFTFHFVLLHVTST